MNVPEDAFKEIESIQGIFLQKIQIIPRSQVEFLHSFPLIPAAWIACLKQKEYSSTMMRQIWAQVDGYLPNAVSLLLRRVVDIGLTVALNTSKVHGLTYFLKHESDKGTSYQGWLGGLPVSDGDVATFEKDSNLMLPQSYRRFCSVHNGLLWNGNRGMGYLPIHELIAWKSVLGFYSDGAGNLQGFDLTQPIDDDDYLTVDWDHETDELTGCMDFWEFVERRFAVEFK